jgi:hypothetical protein
MMTRLMLWASAAVLSLSLMACEDILIPDDPGNGGGGGGGDTSEIVNKLTLSGMLIADETVEISTMPSDATIALVWQRMDGTSVVRSIGTIDHDNYTWSINIDGALPQGDYLETSLGKGVYGMASIVLLRGNVTEGYVFGDDPSRSTVYPIGVAPLTQVIYDTDRPSQDEFAKDFLDLFPAGYSAASIVPFIGDDETPVHDALLYQPAPSTDIIVVFGDIVTTD